MHIPAHEWTHRVRAVPTAMRGAFDQTRSRLNVVRIAVTKVWLDPTEVAELREDRACKHVHSLIEDNPTSG